MAVSTRSRPQGYFKRMVVSDWFPIYESERQVRDELGVFAKSVHVVRDLGQGEELRRMLSEGDVDCIVGNKLPVTDEILDMTPNLKAFFETATGLGNLHALSRMLEMGVYVANIRDYLSPSIAQWVCSVALSWAGRNPLFDAYVSSGSYAAEGYWTGPRSLQPISIQNMMLGVVGSGGVGSHIISWAQDKLGMQVIKAIVPGSPSPSDGKLPLLEVARLSDIVSLQVPLNGFTRGMIGREFVDSMKPLSCLVNVARGPIVDLEAVVDGLEDPSCGLQYYATDVHDEEPPPPMPLNSQPLIRADHRLAALPMHKRLLIPHSIHRTAESLADARRQVWENLEAYLEGTDLRRVETL